MLAKTTTRKLGILLGVIGLFVVAMVSFRPSNDRASVSITFSHYGTLWIDTNLPCGFFKIHNNSSRLVICRGVGASSEQQLTQILSPQGWIDTRCWLSPGAAYFYLAPGASREVPILVETNLPWRIRVRIREAGLIDGCPWFLLPWLPEKARRIPDSQEICSEAVQPCTKPALIMLPLLKE
jgi:hypothetical protein